MPVFDRSQAVNSKPRKKTNKRSDRRRKSFKSPKVPVKKVERRKRNNHDEHASTALESCAAEVGKRFALGCECQGTCYKELQPENVYRHRLNIAELTKQEHDMYLMGVTMACLANRTETNRHKERIRQRASYVYQGKRVCLDAFLYLENVTQYHLKRIRSHVMVNGVIPRVHGNARKKPHNAFSLDMYKLAENFLKNELMHHTNDLNKSFIVVNEPRISIYQKFRKTCSSMDKLMSYSTFRHFLKKQFPHVRFAVSRPVDSTANRMSSVKGSLQRRSFPIKNSTSQTAEHTRNRGNQSGSQVEFIDIDDNAAPTDDEQNYSVEYDDALSEDEDEEDDIEYIEYVEQDEDSANDVTNEEYAIEFLEDEEAI